MNDIIWLRTDGGVVGINLDYLNRKIDEYNKSSFLVSLNCFWDWLSWEEGENLYGISSLWTKDTSKIHFIKRRNDL